MADIWQQFHALPKAIRDAVSTPAVIAALDDLEGKYPDVDISNILMRVVVREVPVGNVAQVLSTENKLDEQTAKVIVERLQRDVFQGVIAEYLGIHIDTTTLPTAPPTVPATPVQPTPATPVTTPLPTAPVVPTPQPVSPVGTMAPTTHYSDADAAEIEQQASKLHALNAVNQDFDTLARSVLTAQNLAFSDDLLDRRSIAVIKSRLKDMRSTKETADVLARDPKIGGLGLDPELAINLATAAERAAKDVKSRGMIPAPIQVEMPAPPKVPTISQPKPQPLPPMRRDAPVVPAPVLPNVTDQPRASRPIVRPKDIPPPPSLPTAPVAPAPAPVAAPSPSVTSSPNKMMTGARMTDRPTVADVVRPAMTLGPAEEMQSMTLIEFRRMGQGAGEASKKLVDKFQHLQKESYAVWAQALAGWRRSDVYQLYVTMGRESLERGVPVSQVIADRGRTGLPYLSEHEFTVLADLNRQLQI